MTSASPTLGTRTAGSRMPPSHSINRPQPTQTASRTRGNSSQSMATGRDAATRGLAPAPKPEDGQQEGGEEDLDPHDQQRRRQHGGPLLGQLTEATIDPGHGDDHGDDHPRQDERPAQGEPVLEPETGAHPVEPRIA